MEGISTKAKVAIILGGLLIVALVIVFLNNKKASDTTGPDRTPVESEEFVSPDTSIIPDDGEQNLTPEPTSSDQINYISPTSSSTKVGARTPVPADEFGIKRYRISVTPAPDAGYFDWTNNYPDGIEIVDLSGSALANKSACEVLGLKNSWSNILEKMSCDTVNFFTNTVSSTLAEIDCAFAASAIKANYNPSITYKLEDGLCLLIDRNK